MIKVSMPTPEIPFKQIEFDTELQNLMEQPWKNTIVIKILGKPWYYPTLLTKLESIWSLRGKFFELMDLGHNCYCIKGLTEEQRSMILTEGPWQLAGSFLSVRKWTPNFRADIDRVEKTITWARILNVPVEMFRESVIQELAACIGDPIKIDGSTFTAKKGRFARFCVEVETHKPLELGLCIRGKIYQVVYENLPQLCYSCGRVNHTESDCAKWNLRTVRKPRPLQSRLAQPGWWTRLKIMSTGSGWLLKGARRSNQLQPGPKIDLHNKTLKTGIDPQFRTRLCVMVDNCKGKIIPSRLQDQNNQLRI